MPEINVSRKDIPFLLGGKGDVTVHASVSNPTAKLTPTDDDLLKVTFGAAGDTDLFSIGAGNSVKVGLKAGANANLTPLWPTSSTSRLAVLADRGLADYFTTHSNDLILILSLGTSADATAKGSFAYSFLTASTTLEAGANAGYFYSRAYPADKSLQEILLNFFSGLRLPANITAPPGAGEVVRFEYGGYLKLGAELSVGYEMKGSPSIDIGQLLLSEHYQLSLIGNLKLGASVAGNFSVEVRSATDAAGASMPDWARVIVRKKRTSQFNIAADVNVDASSDLQGLPDTPNEFLGALLGVNAKNWLNTITQIEAKVRQFSDLPNLQAELDTLARSYVKEWIGTAADKLSNTEFNTFMEKLQKVVASYKNLDNSAISLFDRYYNVVAGNTGILAEKLNELKALTSWDQFKGRVDPELWAIVQRLTGGDPLNFILGRIKIPGPGGQSITPSLPELQRRAQGALDMIQKEAHEEIRKVIALAKSKFPIDGFINDLAAVDSIQKLQALSEDKLGGFIERLIGKGVGELSKSELGKTITRLNEILVGAKNFETRVYARFKEAAKQSFSFKLHASYSRASERDALIDVMINMASDDGKALMRAAGHGDFQNILAGFRPELVKINSGLLTHTTTKQSAFSVNVVGWHSGWNYQGMDRVIINTEQQIKAEDNGGITVFTTIDMTKEKERKRNGERMFTSFLMRFLGESHGVLAFDKANQQYLLDSITGMAANYNLSFDNPKTTARELNNYLSFAADFGLTEDDGASVADLRAVLAEKSPDNFGPVSAEYEVRYTEPGLRALFSAPTPEDEIREIMRKIVLANYIRDANNLAGIGWCYWTPGIFDEWKKGQAQFTNNTSLSFQPVKASPFSNLSAPDRVVLNKNQLSVLSTLFFIEESMVAGLQKLQTLIQGVATTAGTIQPREFERALSKIGDALKNFDDFDEGVNTVFAVFDQLINLRTPASQSRASSLKLVSQVDADGTTREVTKMFIAQPEAADEGLAAGAGTP